MRCGRLAAKTHLFAFCRQRSRECQAPEPEHHASPTGSALLELLSAPDPDEVYGRAIAPGWITGVKCIVLPSASYRKLKDDKEKRPPGGGLPGYLKAPLSGPREWGYPVAATISHKSNAAEAKDHHCPGGRLWHRVHRDTDIIESRTKIVAWVAAQERESGGI